MQMKYEYDRKKKQRVMILGGEGFIGRNIADYLGDCYDCLSVGVEESIFGEKRKDKFIRKNPYIGFVENNYDAVIHLIDNKVSIGSFIKEEEKLIKNVELNSKKHLVLFSSAVVYANPESEYGQRKLALEKFYQDYCAKNKIKLAILRLFNVYGSYQLPDRQGSLVANIFCNYLNGEKITINDPEAKRDFIYAGDISKVIEWVIKNGFEGTDDLAANKSVPIKEILDVIERDVIGNKLDVIIRKDEKERVFSPEAKSGIIKKVRLTDREIGLSCAFDFYKNNLAKIRKQYGL